MKPYALTPNLGMNNAQADEALRRRAGPGDPGGTMVRDAVNVDIHDTGAFSMRHGLRKLTDTPLKNLWQSPLHGDVFATLAEQWVKVNQQDWSIEPLALIGEGRVQHLVLNNRVVAAGPAGLHTYDGGQALPLTLARPAAPMVQPGAGALHAGKYGAAVAWLRGDLESPLSPMAQIDVADGGGLEITFPLAIDPTVTGVRLYLTRQNGGELNRAGDYPAVLPQISVPLLPKPGAAAVWKDMDPMPTGLHLGVWRGRLITASANVLRFSEAMAYHIHDPRHSFVQMPQRITFVSPVDGGIWVGQVDHVAFLAGSMPQDLAYSKKTAQAPVPFSSTYLNTEMAGEMAGGGAAVVAWLAANGFVLGSGSGQVAEMQGKRLKGIGGHAATSVGFAGRLTAAIT